MKSEHLKLLAPLGYMLVIYGLSSIPGAEAPETALQTAFQWVPPSLQNFLHIPLYAGLCYAWLWALGNMSLPFAQCCWAAALISIAYGGFDEWHQMSVPGRYASWTDLALNAIGVVVLLFVQNLLKTPRRKKVT